MENYEVKVGSRIGSMLLDHVIMSFILAILIMPFMFIGMSESLSEESNQMSYESSLIIYAFILGMSLYLNKDAIKVKSIAKRALKHEIIDINTGEIASPLKCFIRNILIILWPIEVIVVLASPSRRIGDFIAGTKVVNISKERGENVSVNFKQIAITIALGFLIMFAISELFSRTGNGAFESPSYIETSYNKELSTQMENVVNSSNPECILDSHIKVFDQVENDTVKYVAATFYLTQNYIERNSEFSNIKNEIFKSMFEVIPKGNFILYGKFIYNGPTSKLSTAKNYDWRE